jgi:hypothetical protein
MEPDRHLEDFIDEQLRRLPPVSAPATLVTRVMAAIANRATLPWWRQTWWHWPKAAQAAVLMVALSAAALAISGNMLFGDGFGPYAELISERTPLAGAWSSLGALLGTLGTALVKVVESFLLPVSLGVLSLYLLCMAFGTALVRVAWKRP